MLPQALLAVLPFLAKIPGALKAFSKSKAFWPAITTGGFLGATGIGELGRAGERKLTKEQLAIQQLLGINTAEATKKLTKESRANTEKYIAELTKAKREEQKQARDSALMESFQSSQDRQVSLIMQAVQGIATTGAPSGQSPVPSGMVGLMRSEM